MFKINFHNRKNIVGINLKKIRKEKRPKISQREFAQKLQLEGLDIDKNRISKIELGKSYVTDIELKIISIVLNVSLDKLLNVETQESVNYDESQENYTDLEIADKKK